MKQLTLLSGDSLASHFPLPGSREARKMTAGSGRRWSGLLKNYGRVGSLVRILLESTGWLSDRSFLVWRASGTKSGRRLKFRLALLGPITSATEHGFLATPTTKANQKCPSMMKHPGGRRLFDATPNAGGDHWGGTLQELGGSGNQYRGTELANRKIIPEEWEARMGFPEGWTDCG